MTLAERIDTYENSMIDALVALSVAQSDDLHAQFALDDARHKAEARIRSTSATKLTEAAIAQAVATDPDVCALAYQALDVRIVLKTAENCVEAQKATGRALSWHVQMMTRATETLMVA